MNFFRKHNYLLIAVAMVFAMRALLPLGVMPSFAEEKGFSLEICMGGGQQLPSQAQKIEQDLASLLDQNTPEHPTEEISDDVCAFASHVSKCAIGDIPESGVQSILLVKQQSVLQTQTLSVQGISHGFLVRAPPLVV